MKKQLRMSSAIPANEIVTVGKLIVDEEPTSDIAWVRWWLDEIGEKDQGCRNEVRHACLHGATIFNNDGTPEFIDAKTAMEFYVDKAKNKWKENLNPYNIW